MRRITVMEIRALKKPGMYRADPTLYLRVSLGGSKSWIQRIYIDGRPRDIGLGGFPLVTLAEARELAFENRRLARRGGNPLAAKRKANIPTFREAAERTHRALAPRWRSRKVAASWMQQLERHAFARLGDLPVDAIGRAEVLAVLTPLWTAKPEIARKVRRNIRATLDWCMGQGYVESNIAGEAIGGALPRMPRQRTHLRAMDYREVAAALDTIKNSGASLAASACLRFTILTACRSGEARGATWDEIDLDARVWRIPGERMKTGREHRVPLSDAAVAVLSSVRLLSDDSGLVFPSPVRPGKPLSDMTLTKVLRDTGLAERATVHGFRSSFRDWCAETAKPREIAEAALAHIVGGVEGAYFRSDLFERRRRLMNQWAAYVTDKPVKIIPIRG